MRTLFKKNASKSTNKQDKVRPWGQTVQPRTFTASLQSPSPSDVGEQGRKSSVCRGTVATKPTTPFCSSSVSRCSKQCPRMIQFLFKNLRFFSGGGGYTSCSPTRSLPMTPVPTPSCSFCICQTPSSKHICLPHLGRTSTPLIPKPKLPHPLILVLPH